MKTRKDVNSDNPAALLDYELAQEKAAALGRLGRALETALAQLRRHDETRRAGDTGDQDDRATRAALVAVAGDALWNFIVQREACGLRDASQVMRDYAVPTDVQRRVGVLPEATIRRLRGTR